MQRSSGPSPKPWFHLSKLLERKGPLSHPAFEPGVECFEILERCKVLVLGAGGLGCELLKNLAYMGFKDIHVIDMDTIDLSNLNRQFLFREADIGKSKAEKAARFINQRVKSCNITPHFCKIQDKDPDFYRTFNIVISGLDSVVARRWINGMLASFLRFDDNGDLDMSSITPLIDGGTEGFKGNARVILLGLTPCVECTLNLYPPQVTYPMCTIAHTPRLPEHCVEYVRTLLWPKERPFGNAPIDGDDGNHLTWIFRHASKRAEEFGILGLTFQKTKGMIKNIIPAVASTNAVIAASCALEAFKLATNCAQLMNNYLNFQDGDGVSAGIVELEKKDDCLICSGKTLTLTFNDNSTLKSIVDFFINDSNYQMKSPALTTNASSSNSTLYISNIPSLEEQTKPNLEKTLKELGLTEGCELYVADQTTPNTLTFKLNLISGMDS